MKLKEINLSSWWGIFSLIFGAGALLFLFFIEFWSGAILLILCLLCGISGYCEDIKKQLERLNYENRN